MTNNSTSQFLAQLDSLLGIAPTDAAPGQENDPALQAAALLKNMDFSAELAPQAELRARWIAQVRRLNPPRSTRRQANPRLAWIAALLIAIALLIVFRQPVLASVSRLLGYVYIPEAGFLPSATTWVLKQPVYQEHDGRSVTLRRGISTPDGTTLWLEFNDTARPVAGARLVNDAGLHLDVSSWEYTPDSPGSRSVTLHFPPLTQGEASQSTKGALLTTLVLTEGWHLPLEWIPAAQSGLPDVRVFPYSAPAQQSATQSPSTTPGTAESLCQEKHGVELCVLAASSSPENTSILLKAHSSTPALSMTGWFGSLAWQSDSQPVTLTDAQGNVYRMNPSRPDTLVSPPVAGDQNVTLTIPGIFATASIAAQTITVDVGADPQPGAEIPLNVTVRVLDSSVHFSKATFIGDGVGSLRLTLDADPVQTVNGITPAALEIGKPDRVDDLYGGGMLEGGKDIFVELMRPEGKITGVIHIPVIQATVIVNGPFNFSFMLHQAVSETPTPAAADPNTFAPVPTSTPPALDSYAYAYPDGGDLKTGDLLYAVRQGEKSEIYIFTPGSNEKPRLVVILPGAVSQIYLHADRQGMDYLAGTPAYRDGIGYIDNLRLYSVRFGDPSQRLLFSFPPNPVNTVGTTVHADWSFDGKYLVAQFTGSPGPGPGDQLAWFDLACRSAGECTPHEITYNKDWSLYKAIFAPNDYRILFSGSDQAGTGEPDLFLLDFNPLEPDRPVVNITTNLFVADLNVSAFWMPDGQIFTVCYNGVTSTTNAFCVIDPSTQTARWYAPMAQNLAGYRILNGAYLSSSAKQLLAIVIPEKATRSAIPELRRLDFAGHLGPELLPLQSPYLEIAISPSDLWVSYSVTDEGRLGLVDIQSGKDFAVLEGAPAYSITWAGWVR